MDSHANRPLCLLHHASSTLQMQLMQPAPMNIWKAGEVCECSPLSCLSADRHTIDKVKKRERRVCWGGCEQEHAGQTGAVMLALPQLGSHRQTNCCQLRLKGLALCIVLQPTWNIELIWAAICSINAITVYAAGLLQAACSVNQDQTAIF